MIFSMTFEAMLKSDTGREFFVSERAFFLWTGTTLAIFQPEGWIPQRKQSEYSLEKGGARTIMGEPPENRARFAKVNDADLAKVVEDAIPQNTKASTDFWLNVFESFCAEKDISIDLTKCSAQDFSDALSRFYVSMRTKQGLVFKKSSYLAVRAALDRHVTVTLQRPFNVFKTQELQESNRVLDGVLKKNKAEGVEKLDEHKEAIRKADMERLDDFFRNVLTEGDAVKLTQYCWLNLTLHFALRGSEVQIQLKKSDIKFEKDGKGEEYVVGPSTDFMSKNC